MSNEFLEYYQLKENEFKKSVDCNGKPLNLAKNLYFDIQPDSRPGQQVWQKVLKINVINFSADDSEDPICAVTTSAMSKSNGKFMHTDNGTKIKCRETTCKKVSFKFVAFDKFCVSRDQSMLMAKAFCENINADQT